MTVAELFGLARNKDIPCADFEVEVFWRGCTRAPPDRSIYVGGLPPPQTPPQCRPLASLFIGYLIGILLNNQ